MPCLSEQTKFGGKASRMMPQINMLMMHDVSERQSKLIETLTNWLNREQNKQ